MDPPALIIVGQASRPGWAQWPALLWVAARGQTSSGWGASHFFPRAFYGLAGVGVGGILPYAVLGWRTGMVSSGAGERAKAQELIADGHVVVTVNGLVSWPYAQGHATRLFQELEQEWAGSGLCVVVSTTKPELAQRYERYGFILVQGSSPAVLFRCF